MDSSASSSSPSGAPPRQRKRPKTSPGDRIGDDDNKNDAASGVSNRRERERDQQSRSATAATTTGIDPTFHGQPADIVAHVAKLCDREGMNALRATCRKFRAVVDDPKRVAKPWPTRTCPFRIKPEEEGRYRIDSITFSSDGTRAAVVKARIGDPHRGGKFEVFDRSRGPYGEEIECNSSFGPTFSPDGKLVVVPGLGQRTRLCQLPDASGPVVVSSHRPSEISFASFLDNNKPLLHSEGYCECIGVCKINRNANRITLSHPAPFFWFHHEDEIRNQFYTKQSAFSGKKLIIAASCSRRLQRWCWVLFRDLKRNVGVAKLLPEYAKWTQDMIFTKDGKYLVVSHFGGMSLFDCSIDRIEDLGEARLLRPEGDTLPGQYPSRPFGDHLDLYMRICTLPTSRPLIAVMYLRATATGIDTAGTPRLRVINFETGELVCDGLNAEAFRVMVAD